MICYDLYGKESVLAFLYRAISYTHEHMRALYFLFTQQKQLTFIMAFIVLHSST